jgi:hypothetical protein
MPASLISEFGILGKIDIGGSHHWRAARAHEAIAAEGFASIINQRVFSKWLLRPPLIGWIRRLQRNILNPAPPLNFLLVEIPVKLTAAAK